MEAEEFRRHNDPVTEEALNGQRAKRDGLWQALRGGAKSLATDGEVFEGEVRAADGLADRRYVGAAVVEKAQLLDTHHRSLEAEIAVLQQQYGEAMAMLADLKATWEARLTVLGLAGFSADRLPAWLQERDLALTAAQNVNIAKLELDGLELRANTAATDLNVALAAAGALTDAAADLPGLIEQAAAFDARQADVRAQLKARNDACDSARLALPAVVVEAKEAAAKWKEWREEWTRQIAAARLQAGIGTAGATTALTMLAEMDTACTDIAEKGTSRLKPMREGIERFTADARELAETCLPEVAKLVPAAIASSLTEALQQAQKDETEHKRLTTAINLATHERATAQEETTLAAAKIAPLLAAAKVTTHAELPDVIQLADAYRAADKEAHDAEQALRSGGDGLPLERLAEEVDGEDPTQIAIRLQEVAEARKAASERRDECIKLRTQAEDGFRLIAGQDTAVQAESKRRDALLLMGDSVDEYVRITIAGKLLKWSIDRYREEKQEPLLLRASELFSLLTCGRFKKLSPNFEAEPVTLTAQRPDGSLLPISGFFHRDRGPALPRTAARGA
ncbi:MAG: hypothetical protein IPH55_06565 [Betaproteobacteria bacterium]|nr:hypothetical protein [Betaproteobacteria bacterium]